MYEGAILLSSSLIFCYKFLILLGLASYISVSSLL